MCFSADVEKIRGSRPAAADVAAAPAVLPSVAQVRHLADIAQGYEGVLDAPDVSVTTATAFSALSPRLDASQEGFSLFRGVVRGAQSAMGLVADGTQPEKLPTGGGVESLLEPGKVLGDAVKKTRGEAALGSAIDDAEWTKVVDSVDVDLGLLLLAVVTVTPLCRFLNVSPVLGFLGVGLLLSQEGVFSENREVDQFCELGIQFLLFEMGLELSVSRLKALGKYAFGLGLNQVVFGNALFAAALLPAGNALGTAVLEKVQSGIGVDELLQIKSPLEAVIIGFGMTLSSSALGLQLMSDRGVMTSKVGTASLGVLLFQDLAVVPFIILLPILQKLQGGELGAEGSRTTQRLGRVRNRVACVPRQLAAFCGRPWIRTARVGGGGRRVQPGAAPDPRGPRRRQRRPLSAGSDIFPPGKGPMAGQRRAGLGVGPDPGGRGHRREPGGAPGQPVGRE